MTRRFVESSFAYNKTAMGMINAKSTLVSAESKEAQKPSKPLKPCCACPETKKARDDWYAIN